jgi:Uma2 family endonuclease
MATATTQDLVTAEQFMAMDLDGAYELVEGKVIALSPGNIEHCLITANIVAVLHDYGRRTGHGHVADNDVAVLTRRDPDTVRGADVAFYSASRLPRSEVDVGLPTVVPDLAVEVFSPSNRRSEIMTKVNEYLDAGVLMVWVVHPTRRQVAIYRPDDLFPTILGDSDVLDQLPELPGFRCPVAEFFD